MPFLNYPYNQAPKVNYPTGDYRKISRLDRGRAEMTQNTRLGGELDREQQWQNALFQKKLEELMKNLYSSGSVGGSSTPGSYGGGRMGSMGRGGWRDAPLEDQAAKRWEEMNPEMAKYYRLLRGAQQMSGAYAGNPLALGYNFGTLGTLGGLPPAGYWGASAPVPDAPSDMSMMLGYGLNPRTGDPQQMSGMPGRSPGWATYKRPQLTDEQLWALSGSTQPYGGK